MAQKDKNGATAVGSRMRVFCLPVATRRWFQRASRLGILNICLPKVFHVEISNVFALISSDRY